MTYIQKEMLQYASKLRNRIAHLKSIRDTAPDGYLHCRLYKDVPYFSRRTIKDKVRFEQYLSKDENPELIRLLAQKKYADWVLPSLIKNLAATESFVQLYSGMDENDAAVVHDLHVLDFCKDLYIPSDQYLKDWLSQTWTERPEEEEPPKHHTLKGDMVRSKSEEFIANSLFYHGQPYLYEKPLYLKGSLYPFFPDYTMLNIYTRTQKFWEHFGKMDDPAYVNKVLKKLTCYHRSGIIIGVNLICTFESKAFPFTSADAERIVTELFCPKNTGLFIP